MFIMQITSDIREKYINVKVGHIEKVRHIGAKTYISKSVVNWGTNKSVIIKWGESLDCI